MIQDQEVVVVDRELAPVTTIGSRASVAPSPTAPAAPAECAVSSPIDDAAAWKQCTDVASGASISLQSGLPYSQRAGRASLLLGRTQQRLGESAEAQEAIEAAVTNLSNTVDESHPALIEARALSGQRLKA